MWKPTLSYQRFSRKHYELNRLYWTQILGHKALIKQLSTASKDELTIKVIDSSLKSLKHLHTVSETREWSEEYLNRSRLHLLVICSANLETYLHDITFWWIANQGYLKKPDFRLSEVGKALGQPILGRSSIPEPLKYAEHLFKVEFKQDLDFWKTAYKLRCAAAHNGGIVTARTIRDIPSRHFKIHELIGLDWEYLKSALASAERIVKKIDETASSKSLRILEVEKELQGLKLIKKLPDRANLWSFIHKHYQLKGISAKIKNQLERELYL